MEKIKYLYDFKGYKVRLGVEEGEYEGIIKDVCLQSMKVSLLKVKMTKPKPYEFSDMQSFYPRDIKSCEILSETKERINGTLPGFKNFRHRIGRKNFILDDLSDCESICPSEKGNDADCESEIYEEEEQYVLELPKHLRARLPKKYAVLNKIDNAFIDAIDHISNECVIGVSFEGMNLGRNGKLYWIGISTRTWTYLFDMKALDKKAFTGGLQSIMESKGILKVIHDCRQPSDSLKHQYNTVLDNVFDTQLADAFITMQYTGKIDERVRSLHVCAKSYLNLDVKDIYVPKNRKLHVNPECDYRLLQNEVLDRFIKNVIYLRLLKDELVEHMLNPLYAATNVYLNVVRSSSEQELQILQPSVPHLMPKSLLAAGLQVLQIKSFGTPSWPNGTVNHKINVMDHCFEAVRKMVPMEAAEKNGAISTTVPEHPKEVVDKEVTKVHEARQPEKREDLDLEELQKVIDRNHTLKRFLADLNNKHDKETRSFSTETSRKTKEDCDSLTMSSDTSSEDSMRKKSTGTRCVGDVTRVSESRNSRTSDGKLSRKRIPGSVSNSCDNKSSGESSDGRSPEKRVPISSEKQCNNWAEFSDNRDWSRYRLIPAGMKL